jgi:hypothetical protein
MDCMHRRTWWRSGLLVALATGCGPWTPPSAPPGVTLRAHAPGGCPDLSGRYAVARNAIFDFAVKPRLDQGWRAAQIDSATITTRDGGSFAMTLWGPRDSVTVELAPGQHFDCVDGWAVLRFRPYNQDMPSELIDPVRDDDRNDQFTMALAADPSGRLHGRVVHESWNSFSIWCGDGCHGGRLPLTTRYQTFWYRWEIPGGWTPEPGVDSSQTQRLIDEERQLENGTPPPGRRP